MKRFVKAATTNTTTPAVTQLIEDISGMMYNSGYDITGSGDEDGDISLTATFRGSDSDKMPTIKLETERSNNLIYINSELSFPTLVFNDSVDPSTTHHWLAEWERVGKYLTHLHEYSFDVDDFNNGDE